MTFKLYSIMKSWKSVFIIMAVCLAMPVVAAGAENKKELKKISTKEQNQLEIRATDARKLFYAGQFEQAIDIYNLLIADMTVNSPLYLCELGTCYWAVGDIDKAKRIFMQAEVLLRGFYDAKSEKKAVSLWGAESSKVYKGDPYERSCLYLFLGLLLLDSGDVDNALACFKSAQLADSDVVNQLYRSDFGLLQMLEAYCYSWRGQDDMYAQSIELALSSFQQTHPQIKPIMSRKQELLKQTENNKKLSETENKAAADKLQNIDKELAKSISALEMSYCKPMQTNFNTLVLLWTGKSPIKKRYGKYGEDRAIVKRPNSEANHYELLIDDVVWMDGIQGFANIAHQATTRGGRQMDNVLASQAAFKGFSDSFGDSLMDSADDVGGTAGLAILAIGLIAKGVAAATKVEADIRCWRLLPEELILVPLSLKPGSHKIKIEHYDLILKKRAYEIQTNISEEKPLNIILAIPPAVVKNKKDQKI